MHRPLFLLAVLAALCLRAAEPTPSQPIPVTQEPSHHTVFENDVIRIIDVQIAPGQECLYHVHLLPSVVVYLTKSTNKSQTWGESDPAKFLERTLQPGESRYAPYDLQPLTHRVTNTGAGLFRVFDIELLHPKPSTAVSYPSVGASLVPQWQEKLVRLSKVALPPGETLLVPAMRQSHLLVGIAGHVTASSITNEPPARLTHADYKFFPAGVALTLRNSAAAPAELLLLDLN